MPTAYTVGKVTEFTEGRGKVVNAGGTPVALFLYKEKFHALGNVCRHRGGPIGEGEIDPSQDVVVCPWHGWRYNLETGVATLNPMAKLPVYPVEVVGDEVRVTV